MDSLSAEYDHLYEEADKLFKEYDPCKFEDGSCVHNRACMDGTCGQPHQSGSSHFKDGCCGHHDCEHHTSTGCSVRALGCKLTVCTYLYDTHNIEFREKLQEIRVEAQTIFGYDASRCFLDKEGFFKHLKTTKEG